MNKYDENYSVYFGTPSAEYPEGSAIDSTDEDKLDGTPLLAKFMNDVIGFMYAAFHGVYGNPKIPGQTVTRQLSNEPENATRSDVWDAIKKFVADSVQAVRDALNAFMSTKGQANGIAPLDSSGKVSASYLPSYVDDVLEYNDRASFPASGENGKIYVAKDTNKSYRWSGSTYVELSKYDNATQSASGLMSAADKTKLDGIAEGATNTPAPVNADWNAASGLAQILNKPAIPTKTSQLENDSGFLTSHQSLDGYATEDWVKAQGYKTSDAVSSVNGKTGAVTIDVPTKTSELTNDSGFLTSHQSLAGYATEEWVQAQGYKTSDAVSSVNGKTGEVTIDVPTKTSQLTNDSGFPQGVICNSYTEVLNTIKLGENVSFISLKGAINQMQFNVLSRDAIGIYFWYFEVSTGQPQSVYLSAMGEDAYPIIIFKKS